MKVTQLQALDALHASDKRLASEYISEASIEIARLEREVEGLRSAISVALAHLTIDDERGAFDVLMNAEKGVFPGASEKRDTDK